MSFLIDLTPVTDRASSSAVARSLADLANPDSMTVPLSVSTLRAAALTSALLMKRAFTRAVIAESSIYDPTVSWPRVTAHPPLSTSEPASSAVAIRESMFMMGLSGMGGVGRLGNSRARERQGSHAPARRITVGRSRFVCLDGEQGGGPRWNRATLAPRSGSYSCFAWGVKHG